MKLIDALRRLDDAQAAVYGATDSWAAGAAVTDATNDYLAAVERTGYHLTAGAESIEHPICERCHRRHPQPWVHPGQHQCHHCGQVKERREFLYMGSYGETCITCISWTLVAGDEGRDAFEGERLNRSGEARR